MKIATLSLSGFDPLEFFSKLSTREKNAAYFTSGIWTIVAWNPTRTIRIKNDKIFGALRRADKKRYRSYKGDLPFIGGCIGYLDYDVEKKGGIFHQYEEALLWNGTKIFAIGDRKFTKEVRSIHGRFLPSTSSPNPFSRCGWGEGGALASFDTNLLSEKQRTPLPKRISAGRGDGGEVRWKPSITRTEYTRAFQKIQHDIKNGEYYQLNLTYTLEAMYRQSKRQLFTSLLRANPASCSSYFEDRDLAVLSLSPERFVTIDHGRITTCPIKGTRPRGKTSAEDLKFRTELLGSEKETAELNMITDLLRNDIGKVSKTGTVQVTAHRRLQKNPTVWHTYSVIEGELLPDVHPVQVLRSMFPGGSVTGCPKQVAIERIDQLEKRKRGPYCGSMVMLSDSGRMDSTILIRTIVAEGNRLSLGIGGGIVADSKVEDEWQETKQKAKAFASPPAPLPALMRLGRGEHRQSALDPSNPNVYGVFETMRVEDGQILDCGAHLKRLKKSAAILKMKLPRSMTAIRSLVKKLLTEKQHSLARLKLVCTPTDILIDIQPLLINQYEKSGISATFIQCERALPEGKILPYHREWNAHEEAKKKGYDEALLVDASGSVPEAAYGNIFWVREGTLCTANRSMLPGITRAKVLTIAKQLKIPVRFALPKKSDLLLADEVFLTKSTVGITPIIRIQKTMIGNGRRGKITETLMKRLFSATLPRA